MERNRYKFDFFQWLCYRILGLFYGMSQIKKGGNNHERSKEDSGNESSGVQQLCAEAL